jgi:hypothetical protein
MLQVMRDGITGFEQQDDFISIGAPQIAAECHPHGILHASQSCESAHLGDSIFIARGNTHLGRTPVQLRKDSTTEGTDGSLNCAVQVRETRFRGVVRVTVFISSCERGVAHV